jgi:hypothetical protein
MVRTATWLEHLLATVALLAGSATFLALVVLASPEPADLAADLGFAGPRTPAAGVEVLEVSCAGEAPAGWSALGCSIVVADRLQHSARIRSFHYLAPTADWPAMVERLEVYRAADGSGRLTTSAGLATLGHRMLGQLTIALPRALLLSALLAFFTWVLLTKFRERRYERAPSTLERAGLRA